MQTNDNNVGYDDNIAATTLYLYLPRPTIATLHVSRRLWPIHRGVLRLVVVNYA